MENGCGVNTLFESVDPAPILLYLSAWEGTVIAGKENQRIMLTKKLLKDSLTELLKAKSIYHVSIRELCEKVEINRSTFYKYCGSQFDLLTEMEGDVISLVMQSLTEMCSYLEDNIKLSRLLINNNVDPQFPEKIFTLPQVQQTIDRVLDTIYAGAEYEYISGFLTYGAYQIIRFWINKDVREAPEIIANLILKQIIGIA